MKNFQRAVAALATVALATAGFLAVAPAASAACGGANVLSACFGGCTYNVLFSYCGTHGACEVNVDAYCAGACGVNVQGSCHAGGSCDVNLAGSCSARCALNVLATCTHAARCDLNAFLVGCAPSPLPQDLLP